MFHMRSSTLWWLPATVALAVLASCGEKAPPVHTYPMGERVPVGHLVYAAFDTQWLPQIGTGLGARVPQNRFLLVRVSITNSAGERVAAPDLTIVDDAGKSFQELSDGQDVPQWIGYLRQINATDTAQGNLVFDVPPRHYKLRVTDEQGDQSALIDLPLEFNPQVTPDVQIPDMGKK